MERIYTPKIDYKVLTTCYTYNQAKFIEDTLKGFAMQKTSFPIVFLLIEDCSSDGEQEVIKAWMERECDMTKAEYIDLELANVIIVPHKIYTCSFFAFYWLKKNLYGKPEKGKMIAPWREHCKYEALCEGDDFWIDENKLQRQVDLIEKDKNTAMVYSRSKRFNQSLGTYEDDMGCETSFEDLLCSFNTIPTASLLFRKDVYEEYNSKIAPSEKKWKMGDYPLNLYFLKYYGVKMLNEETTVYRIVENSASHNQDESKLISYYKSIFDIKRFYYELNQEDARLRQRMCHNYLHFAYSLYQRFHHNSVSQLIDEVYTYMNTKSLPERIVHSLIMCKLSPRIVNKVLLRLYASRLMSL